MYVIAQEFSLPGDKRFSRRGFVAACRLEEFGKGSVYPHEKTLAKPKEDRFRLFQATHAMFSQIFCLFPDPVNFVSDYLNFVMTASPIFDVEFENTHTRMWSVKDDSIVLSIAEFMKHQRVLVADGHHRYETAIMYKDAERLRNPHHTGKEPYNFVPVFFTSMNDPGLIILPTHRLLHSMNGFQQGDFLRQVGEIFDVNVVESPAILLKRLTDTSSISFGLLLPEEPYCVFLSLNGKGRIKVSHLPPVVSQLDVTILHRLIFQEMLGMSPEAQEKKLYLEYVKEIADAKEAVRSGRAQAAFLMNATRIEQVRAVAEAGLVMPQKSTYFYPKLLSGTVIYSFKDE